MCPAGFLIPPAPAAPRLPLAGSLAVVAGAGRLATLHRLVYPHEPVPRLDLDAPGSLPGAMQAFLARVEATHFPLCASTDQPAPAAHLLWCLEAIPIGLYGLDNCQNAPQPGDEPWYLAYHLMLLEHWGAEELAQEETWAESVLGQLGLPPDLCANLLLPTLRRMALPAPLDGLPDLLTMAYGYTGSFFLDTCPSCWEEDGEERPEWDAPTVAALRADWQHGRPIWERVAALATWVEADVRRGRAAIVQALGQAHAQANQTDPPQEAA